MLKTKESKKTATKKQKLLDELAEKLYNLSPDELNYIIYALEEFRKGNKNYTNMTYEEILKDFDEWQARQKAVQI